ncbi:MAG TPA: DNA polymerase III subunit delta [Acidimicrobiales bacterium]|nr:DNA polymerase III subunit delta [Acidimicrobiales bacterium]
MTASSYLVKGDDPALVAQVAQDLLQSLLGGRDPSATVEEHGGGGEDIDPGAVVDALTTAPFLTDCRIVVVRDAGRLLAADAGRIAGCLAEPVPGVILVLVGGAGTVPAAVVKAVQKHGAVVDGTVGTGRARSQWLAERLRQAPVRLDARAAATLGEHLGGDLSRLRGLLDTLVAAYGEGASIGEDRLAPFLGEAGSVPSWDLTDAINAGDTPGALEALHRLMGAGDTHALVVMARLHRHFQDMLRLDGAGVSSGEQAAELLGSRSVYPAKKALEQGRRLGPGRVGRAITLLAEADLDLRGRTGLDSGLVLEVLVARLSRVGVVRDSAAGRRAPARA